MFRKTFLNRVLPFSGLLLSLLLVLICASVAHAVIQNLKLSGEITGEGDTNVIDFKISPDGIYTVFTGDLREGGKHELFSVHTLGGERVLLSPDLPEEFSVGYFSVTPDSQKVVYYLEGTTLNGLYVVPITGGTSIELAGMTDGLRVSDIKVTEDGSNVFFIGSPTTPPFTYRLYRVPIEAGTLQIISEENAGWINYMIAQNNQQVVYLQDASPSTKQLIQSDLDGDKTILDEADISAFKITPDSANVIYRKLTGIGNELFSIPIDDGTPVRLNSIFLPPGANVDYDFKITPDSNFVVYKSDERRLGDKELFRAPVEGGTEPLCLTPGGMVADGDVYTFKISPDSQWVVYQADQLVDDRHDLFSVSIAGGLYNRLNPGMVIGDVQSTFEIAPNSLGVAFIADGLVADRFELFAALIDGSAGVRLNDPLPPGGDVSSFKISNNSQGVVYRADQDENDVWNLYAVPSLGGTSVQVNPPLVEGGVTFGYLITSDNKGVVYIADQETDEVAELFITYDFPESSSIFLPLVVR